MSYFFTVGGEFYTYKITKESIELVTWNEAIPKFKEIMQLFLCIISVFIVFIFITDPSILLISLGGIAGVGVIAGVALFSKSYLETHLKYKHLITRWDSLLKIKIDNRGNPIILIWGKDFYHKKQQIYLFNLFCTPEIFDKIVKLIQEQVKEENVEKGIHYGETWG